MFVAFVIYRETTLADGVFQIAARTLRPTAAFAPFIIVSAAELRMGR